MQTIRKPLTLKQWLLHWTLQNDTSTVPGPRNWQPLALTAAHRLDESCCGFWCWRMSSVTVRSPNERAARIARIRPSSSTSWQWTRVTSFLCMGRLSTLCAALLSTTPATQQNTAQHRLHLQLAHVYQANANTFAFETLQTSNPERPIICRYFTEQIPSSFYAGWTRNLESHIPEWDNALKT